MKLIELIEAGNHGGYRHGTPKHKRQGQDGKYTEYGAWRAACRIAPGFSKFEGDKDGCVAVFNGVGNTRSAGEWDGQSGTKTSTGISGSFNIRKELEAKVANAKRPR